MMNNLEDMLARLGTESVHPRISKMDEGVLAGLSAHEAARRMSITRPLGAVALAALVVGVAGSGLSGAPAVAAPSLTQLGSSAALAPSTLLLASK